MTSTWYLVLGTGYWVLGTRAGTRSWISSLVLKRMGRKRKEEDCHEKGGYLIPKASLSQAGWLICRCLTTRLPTVPPAMPFSGFL